MASSNPAFSRNPAFAAPGTLAATKTLSDGDLQALYNAPSAGSQDTGRMTYEDTIVKTTVSFAVLLLAAAAGWILLPTLGGLVLWGSLIVGFVLGLVNSFKRVPSPPLILAYAAFEGLFVGAISALFEFAYNGIVFQAVLATLAVVGVTLALFANGKIRASARATKIFLIAMVGYFVFSLLNLGLTAFGVLDNPFGLRAGVLGVVIGLLAVLLAAYSLVLDFDSIQRGVRNGAPRIYAWSGAFGIMVTVVWLYVEILRIFAIVRE